MNIERMATAYSAAVIVPSPARGRGCPAGAGEGALRENFSATNNQRSLTRRYRATLSHTRERGLKLRGDIAEGKRRA